MVIPLGLEPKTYCLEGNYSTSNWATEPLFYKFPLGFTAEGVLNTNITL